jgi:ABC-2 type transport system permease protein
MLMRIYEILRKELRQTLREPRMRVLLVLPPLVQLLLFGYAVNLDVEKVQIAWMDRDHTAESRDLRAAFTGSGRFEILAEPDSEIDVQRLLDRSEVQGIVRILPGFARDIQRGNTAAVQILIEGTNSNTAGIVTNYASTLVANYSRQLAIDRAGGHEPSGLNTESRVWFNPELHSRLYFVPGVLANLVAFMTIMMTAMAIVREKEIGTMEQLMVTPIRSIELMIGKAVPFALVGLFNMVTITIASLLVFHVPLRGSVLMLAGATSVFLMTSLGLGLFVSTISQTQQQSEMATFFIMQPIFMLSGFAIPIRNMPETIQYLTYLNPLRYYIDIVRGVFLKGSGMDVLWPQVLALAVFGVVILGLSSARFSKCLD